jgi:hypothetical protein
VIVLVNSAGVVACAVQLALAARRERRLTIEVTELQGLVDGIYVAHGWPSTFAERYGVEIIEVAEPDEP